MTNIVERLRNRTYPDAELAVLTTEAADEIEKLTSYIEALEVQYIEPAKREIELLRKYKTAIKDILEKDIGDSDRLDEIEALHDHN